MSIPATRSGEGIAAGIDFGKFVSLASFWSPQKLVSSAWIEHAPFAFWLVDALRPRRIVELGVFQGFSYFAFCQAVAQLGLPTKCFGVDTWRGDQHGGFYGNEVFDVVSSYNADRYSDFSRLICSTFDEAQSHFADGTIDLLHIDGRHFYEDVRHDYEHWLKKLSSAAVVLFHDTNVYERGFGVAQLWDELRRTHYAFEFEHGHGLGVLCAGPHVPAQVHHLCATTSPPMRRALRIAYARLGHGIAEELAFRTSQLRELALEERMSELEAEANRMQVRAAQAEAEANRMQVRAAQAEAEANSLRSSTIWRLSAPVRQVIDFTFLLLRQPQRLRTRKQRSIDFSSFFDADWYAARYPESTASGLTPLQHFLIHGAAKGWNPNPAFDAAFYLARYPDVASSGMTPFEHFVRFGAEEGRQPTASFDVDFYRLQCGLTGASNLEAYNHYLRNGQPTGSLAAIPASAAASVLGEATTAAGQRVCIGIVAFRADAAQITRVVTSAQRSLARCGEGLTAEIRVVDHGGTLKASDLPKGVDFISAARNEGFGMGHNKCMRAAFYDGADAYIAANPDGAFHPDCLRSMLVMHSARKGRALIEAQQFPEEHPKYFDPVTLRTTWVSGACMLIPRSLWQQTGGFDPSFFLYCEDVDLSWIARRLGFETLMCPSALFWHDVSGRRREDWRWREMLISGRYLAYKWKNPTFREWTERQLLKDGFVQNFDRLPSLDDRPTVPDGENIAEFRFGFHFAPARW